MMPMSWYGFRCGRCLCLMGDGGGIRKNKGGVDKKMKIIGPTQPRGAFTLVELLAVLAIIAMIIAAAIPYVGAYVDEAKRTSKRQTLATLNQALTRYKTQGGDLQSLTADASISRVLGLLKTPVTWGGHSHQFWSSAMTLPAASLEASGSAETYHFSGFNGYTEETL